MNYIYLSDDERIRFAQNSHEYLITQVQHIHGDTIKPGITKHFSLSNFNHPVKEIIWCLQREEVKNRIRERTRYRLKNDPIFRLKSSVRTRIYLYVKRGLAKKTLPTSILIGCSWEFLKNHLEKQFKPNMSWANYGKWHIDHYRPMASFNLLKEKELLKCCNFSNLQPLWAFENLSKGAKLEF